MTPDQINPERKTTDELVMELLEQGNELTTELGTLTSAVDRQTRARRSNNVAAGIVIAVLALVAIDNRVGLTDLQQKMCPLVQLLGPGVSNAPPSTERGRDMAREAGKLAGEWDCGR